jgi:hypothetical protein
MWAPLMHGNRGASSKTLARLPGVRTIRPFAACESFLTGYAKLS